MSSINCPKCGAPADSQGSFCGNCGYAFKGDGAATSSPSKGQQSGGFASPFPAPGSLSTPSSPTYSTNSMHSSSAYQGAGFPPPPPPPPSYQAGNTPSSSLYPASATPPPPPLSSPSYPTNGAQFSQAAPPKIDPNMPPAPKRMGKKRLIAILSVVVIIILAGTVGIFEFMSHNQTTSISSSTPNTTPTSQSGSNTASPTQSVASPTSDTSSATPGATTTLTVQPSAPVISGVAVKNLTLPCSACAADPVHVIINSIQVDTANGRMIWDTTLKDVTNSNSGFSVNQFSLLASGSTTQVDAVLSQSQFSGNQANMQAIFALLPAQGEIYTLTVVVNWYQNSSNNLAFDPIQFSFAADGTPTAVLPQPTPTVKAGSITKNLTLTCSQCASDPVHVTINTIQIDTANGRMIWDTTLKDVTNSNSGFSVNQYSIEASATAKVDAVLPQTQFSGNSADVQAIFAFVPSPGVTYTFTVVVNWYQNSSNNLAFDPVQITF